METVNRGVIDGSVAACSVEGRVAGCVEAARMKPKCRRQ